ncbi:MAG TPA: helix-turn-helix domain-containing protein [Haliscomenobacter sp.]|uniref:helix-turn-helix transcriptional regulator n=1 Tax=Haliscomenobacter sp. TaxID=2717303 RepID=UPI002CC5F3DD|nr:helix-turn-helix domain-containing protein [Haliscomenobacter sp.]HOY20345.1 helix-turn-helix domain-containing protein [Haliscomenobacter sp.]
MQNQHFSASKIVYELTPEQLELLTTEAARKAVELSRVKPDHWGELPDLIPTKEAAHALSISVSTFKRRVREGLFTPHYEKSGGHPLFDKSELRTFYERIVG